jgi:hypothetical protein
MAVEITCRTSDDVDDPIVALTAVHIEVAGLDPWTAAPTEADPSATTQNVFRIFADGPQAARDDGWSHAFSPSAEGDHEWDGYIFPEAGSATIRVYQLDAEGAPDTEVGTLAVTVVEPA